MSISLKKHHQLLRKRRIRSKIKGTAERPRLSVFISNTHISAQIINDQDGTTLISSTTVGAKNVGNNLTEKASWVGEDIAKKAIAKKIKNVVLDRNGKLYHGRVASLADSARKTGLEL